MIEASTRITRSKGRERDQAAEKVEIQQELRQDVKQLGLSSMLIPKSGSL